MIERQHHEAALVHQVYSAIVGASWFNRNTVTERELLKLVLRRLGCENDETEPSTKCESEARERFARRERHARQSKP